MHRVLLAHRDMSADDVDFFPTPIWAARACGELVLQLDPQARTCWEPACGAGHMAHGLSDYFRTVYASDAYPYDGNQLYDFLSDAPPPFAADWIVSNPPFSRMGDFIRLAYSRARRGVALLCRAAVLESAGRYALHTEECPLTVFAPFSERVPMHRGRWEPDGTSAAFYAVFVWIKPALRPRRFMARVGGVYRPATMLIAPGAEARLTRPDDARLFGAMDRARDAR